MKTPKLYTPRVHSFLNAVTSDGAIKRVSMIILLFHNIKELKSLEQSKLAVDYYCYINAGRVSQVSHKEAVGG